MEKIFNLKAVADAVGGKLLDADEEKIIENVSIDSRTINKGELFVAIRGNTDGHKYINNALENGAVCVIADKKASVADGTPRIIVEDTGKALLDLSGAYRKKMNIPIIAVTGSVGKTSTRTIIGCVLSRKYTTLVTEGNFNNEIGVPLTLFNISKEHQIAVIEMGMNHFGELSKITAAVRPDVVVITNIGESHIENLGSKEGILKAKLESLEGLTPDGTVVLNGDDELLWNLNGSLNFETLYCGINNLKSDICAKNIKTYPQSTEFTFYYGDNEYQAELTVPGGHHVYNALLSVLIGIKYNIPIDDILMGIYDFAPRGMRQATVKIGDYTVIKDCYNASPVSMKSGLEVLKLNQSGKRKVACLGDMLELGTITEKAHRETGEEVVAYGADVLITVGERAKLIAQGAISSGMSRKKVYSFLTTEELCKKLHTILESGDVILLKASRLMEFENIASYMEEHMK